MNTYLRMVAGTSLVLGLFLIGTINLDSTPPLWWDEGWNLSIARNWVELGHYGRLLLGRPAPAGLEGAFSVIAPVAFSFRLFGLGIWQGRIIGVVFTLGALALIYYLALRLYNRSVAIATLGVLLFMSAGREIHPILMGRQVLGEMPAVFYLLAGYACLLESVNRPTLFVPLTILSWSIALITKQQVLPFWMVSLLIPWFLTIYRRCWKWAGLLTVGLFSSLIMRELLFQLREIVARSQMLPPIAPLVGLYDVTAFVPVVSVRLAVLILTLILGLPTLLGLCYAASKLMRNSSKVGWGTCPDIVKLALLVLVGSWLGWYLFLSVGWTRYLFPATFIGSIFVAAWLHHLTDGFNLASTIKHCGNALRPLHFSRENTNVLLATLLIACTSFFTIQMLYRSFIVNADTSALLVADFINNQTASNALIETYDSELFFFLERRYHYPPDQIHIELNRRIFLHQDVHIDYDPLAADPDYLVVGPQSKLWRLYDPVLVTGEFRLLRSYSRYDVYGRVR